VRSVPNLADQRSVATEPLSTVTSQPWDRRRKVPNNGRASATHSSSGSGIRTFSGELSRGFSHTALLFPTGAAVARGCAPAAAAPQYLSICEEWERKIVATQGRLHPRNGPSIHDCLQLDKLWGVGHGTGDFAYKTWNKRASGSGMHAARKSYSGTSSNSTARPSTAATVVRVRAH
jgi:hypothetical protein